MDIIDYDLTIPSILLDIDGVTKTDLKVYSILRSLARQNGYCSATNGYLAEKLQMNERNVQKFLARLKNLGLIEIHVTRGYPQTTRKIMLAQKVEVNQ